jgi:hypothetical protein
MGFENGSVSSRDIDDAHHSLRLVFQDVAMKHATAKGIDAQANKNLLTRVSMSQTDCERVFAPVFPTGVSVIALRDAVLPCAP